MQLTVKKSKGSTYNVYLNGVYHITDIRRKYETWLVPYNTNLLEVNNLQEVSQVITGFNDTNIKLAR